MSVLKAPYNFVPLSKQVVTPEWAPYVSHDVPFEDAQSGELEVEIEAYSPIYVRDGQPKGSLPTSAFSQMPDGQYFIPGSSIKGMVRAVLEIMTFGKMGNRVNDHRYAIRDLNLKEDYLNHFLNAKIYGGWLFKDETSGNYKIKSYDIPGRITHKELDKKSKKRFSSTFSSNQDDDYKKSAKYKYTEIWGKPGRVFSFIENDKGHYEFCDEDEEKEGTLVFTGQPGPNHSGGKYKEFIFFNSNKSIDIEDDKVIEDFRFAYFAHDEQRQSEDWKYWHATKEPIPVFFYLKEGKVAALGLSYLFKLPYKKSIEQALPDKHRQNEDMDFADVIFGTVPVGNEKKCLKGRVHFGHATPTTTIKILDEKTEVLSSPKASYFPNYVLQDLRDNDKKKIRKYRTFMDDSAQIAGWKRYPIRKGKLASNPTSVNSLVGVSFTPIDSGAKFKLVIRYHNLKKVELGALLSSLTFHNHNYAFHSLGMAKPLGYGKVKLNLNLKSEQLECLKYFEIYMVEKISDWLDSSQIVELLSMACEQDNVGSSELSYMSLDTKGKNEFVEAKKEKQFLNRYSDLDAITEHKLKALSKNEDLTKIKPEIIKTLQKYPSIQRNKIQDEIASFEKSLLLKKQLLITALKEQRNKIKAREAELEKERETLKAQQDGNQQGDAREEKARKAKEKGLDLSSLPNKGKVFDALKTLVKEFVQDYYTTREKLARYDKLLEMSESTGVVPEIHHDVLIEKIQSIARSSTRDMENWQKPYDKNAELKKVGEWIGVEKARNLKF